MDIGDNGGDIGGFGDVREKPPRALPDDLPRSLDDRKNVPSHLAPETEMYDAWQGTMISRGFETLILTSIGQSQFLTTPVLAKPLQFNSLSLDDKVYDDDLTSQKIGDSDARLMEMLAAQAAHRDGSASADEDAVASDDKLSAEEKKDTLQKVLNMAASNGDVERIQRILNGKAKEFVDIDAPDEEGTAPLIYASCFVGINFWSYWGYTDQYPGTRSCCYSTS
jgi:hypothetical protein